MGLWVYELFFYKFNGVIFIEAQINFFSILEFIFCDRDLNQIKTSRELDLPLIGGNGTMLSFLFSIEKSLSQCLVGINDRRGIEMK